MYQPFRRAFGVGLVHPGFQIRTGEVERPVSMVTAFVADGLDKMSLAGPVAADDHEATASGYERQCPQCQQLPPVLVGEPVRREVVERLGTGLRDARLRSEAQCPAFCVKSACLLEQLRSALQTMLIDVIRQRPG